MLNTITHPPLSKIWNFYFRRKNSKSKEGVQASYIIFYNLDLSEDVNGVSCKAIHSFAQNNSNHKIFFQFDANSR